MFFKATSSATSKVPKMRLADICLAHFIGKKRLFVYFFEITSMNGRFIWFVRRIFVKE